MEGQRRYKSWELYSCLALNRLAAELDIDIYQSNISDVLDTVFSKEVPTLPKNEISFEIKSNYTMTNKVLKKLEADGLITVHKDDRKYNIAITKEGVLYLRQFNAYFVRTYHEIIQDHYRFREMPRWFQAEQ